LINVAAALVFAGFTLLVLLCWRQRRMVHLLAAYVLFVTLGVALTQLDLWPFSAWPLIALYHPPTVTHTRMTVVDEAGMEHPIDARAWGSLSMLEIASWLGGPFEKLSSTEKATACGWLLDTLERARERVSARGSFGREGRPLGPFTAPYFIVAPHWWDNGGLPRRRLVAFRVYRDTWDIELRARDANAVNRELVYEYRAPATLGTGHWAPGTGHRAPGTPRSGGQS
jgi:hypothetical protein